MRTEQIRLGVNARLTEARMLLSLINNDANAVGIPQPSPNSSMIKGMIYVSMYGALEYCVTQGVQALMQSINQVQVRHTHIANRFNVLALDSVLTAARDAGPKKKWSSRIALFDKLEEKTACVVPDTVFGAFLHNIWPATLEEIFLCLGIDKPAVSSPREATYLTEIVEKRNAVAHGRDTASEAGEGLTYADITLRLDTVYQVCLYFLSTLDEHSNSQIFIKPRHRRAYHAAA